MLFWRAYTKDGTLNFSNSVGLPNTFSFKDVINLARLPVSLQNKNINITKHSLKLVFENTNQTNESFGTAENLFSTIGCTFCSLKKN